MVTNRNKLVEYTSTARCVRTIIVDFSLLGLRHGVLMNDDHFIVCLRNINSSCVCMIDNVGQLVKQVGGNPGSRFGEFDWPSYIDCNEYTACCSTI